MDQKKYFEYLQEFWRNLFLNNWIYSALFEISTERNLFLYFRKFWSVLPKQDEFAENQSYKMKTYLCNVIYNTIKHILT
jgi:hypothetical protein